MVMGYIDNLASMVLCISRLGIYSMRGQGYRDYGDYLYPCGALECFFATTTMVSCVLLYNRLLYGGYTSYIGVPMGHQEKLYSSMAEARNTHSASLYLGYRQGPIY